MIEVTLEHHDDDTLARFGNEITRLPEVVEAFRSRANTTI